MRAVEPSRAGLRPRLSAEILLFSALLVIHLIPLWTFPFVPTQDGPDHQALARILREYDAPGAGLLRTYYLPNHESLPNWFVYFLLDNILGFLPVPAAEKVLLSLYILLVPLSMRFALRSIDPQAAPLSVLAFPFLYNFPFHMGFYNFCFSLAAFFFTLGFWLRRQDRLGPPGIAVLGALALWTYFSHPVSFVLVVVALFTLAGWRMLLDLRERGFWPGIRTWILPPLLAFLPALALMAAFVGRRLDETVSSMSLGAKTRHLSSLYSLVSMDERLVVLSTAFAALFGVVAGRLLLRRLRQRGFGPGDGLLLMVLAVFALYFVAPNDFSGGGFITHRLNLYLFLSLILWFATFELGHRERLVLQAGAVVVALGILGLLWPRYAEVNDGLAEIVAAGEHIPPDSTVLSLSYAPFGLGRDGRPLAFRVRPFLHAAGYIAARKRIVDLSLYQADRDYFPIYYAPSLDPYKKIGIRSGLEGRPPRVDFLSYPERTGGHVDYVLVWRPDVARQDDPWVRSVRRQLAAGYEPVYTSPRDWVRLWRRRGATRLASTRPAS